MRESARGSGPTLRFRVGEGTGPRRRRRRNRKGSNSQLWGGDPGGPVAAFVRVRRRPDAYGRTLRTSAELWPEVEARDTCPEIINVEKDFKLWIQARSPRERAAGEEV